MPAKTKKVVKTKEVSKKPEAIEQTISVCIEKAVLKTNSLCEFSSQAIGNLERLFARSKNGLTTKNLLDDYFSFEERKSGELERKLKKFKRLFMNSSNITLEVKVDSKKIKSLFNKRYLVIVKFSGTSSIVNMYYGTYNSSNPENFIALYHVELVNM